MTKRKAKPPAASSDPQDRVTSTSNGSEQPQAVVAKQPVDYSEELAARICGELARGRPLVRVLEADGMPHIATIYVWRKAHPDFDEMYARAREDQADTLADETMQIADADPDLVAVINAKGLTGELKVDTAYETWRRTRIDTRKWFASKMLPKRYGDKVEQTLRGPNGEPIAGVSVTVPVINLFAPPPEEPPT